MTITAEVILDSISSAGIRLTTFQLRYPRFIHAEFMTHRMFSRNASSSRAIPIERMIEDLRRDPAMPVYWGSHQKGMQAGPELTEGEIQVAQQIWLTSMENAIHSAYKMHEIGLHKQIANRMLEPWAHINVVCTATDWANFFALRRHKDAQPEIKVLADVMWDALQASTPARLLPGDWHLPFVRKNDIEDIRNLITGNGTMRIMPMGHHVIERARKVSVARCARVSYLTHDGRETTAAEDMALYDRLVGGIPLHASPTEHQATPDTSYLDSNDRRCWDSPETHGNLTGWQQFRKLLPNEHITEYSA